MKTISYIILILLLSTTLSLSSASAQKVQYIRVPDLEKILKNPENKLFVLNLWATWCPPCVKEMPAFEKTAAQYGTENVRFVMVSLDFPSQVEKQLIPFLKKNNITLDVAVMMDTDYDSWISKVDEKWQGNIPATLFFNNHRQTRYFHTGELTESELKTLISKYL